MWTMGADNVHDPKKQDGKDGELVQRNVQGRPTLASLWSLPPTLSASESFAVLGIGTTRGWEEIRSGRIKTLRIGARVLVLTLPLLQQLGVEIPARQDGDQSEVEGFDSFPFEPQLVKVSSVTTRKTSSKTDPRGE
ncbi:MAG: hypothetical protein M3P01_10665 [Actinomycetota bacterium]|nr:hypothetical protein [Actinomycetota bacterium]